MKAIQVIKFIGKIVAYPFEEDRFVVIVIVAMVMGIITNFEFLIFKIPFKFFIKICLSNIVFMLIGHHYGGKLKDKEEMW